MQPNTSHQPTRTSFPRLWEHVHIIYQDGSEYTAESFKLDWNNPNIVSFKIIETDEKEQRTYSPAS